MWIGQEDTIKSKEEVNSLDFVKYNKTNIQNIKFLSHFEYIGGQHFLKNLAKEPNIYLKNLYDKKYQIFDAKIDVTGKISTFKIRFQESPNINEINILDYVGNDVHLPKEIRNFIPDESEIYTIRFYSAKKIEIEESKVEEYVEDERLVIFEDDKYYLIVLGESLEKYWTEDPLKAIFYLKSLGFYIGANEPNVKENYEILKGFVNEDEILMSTSEFFEIEGIETNIAIINKRKINWKLSDCIRFKYTPYKKRIPKKANLLNTFKTENAPDLEPDKISKEIEKLKMPRR